MICLSEVIMRVHPSNIGFFPLDVLDEIWDLIESVSEGFLTYSWKCFYKNSQLVNNRFRFNTW